MVLDNFGTRRKFFDCHVRFYQKLQFLLSPFVASVFENHINLVNNINSNLKRQVYVHLNPVKDLF